MMILASMLWMQANGIFPTMGEANHPLWKMESLSYGRSKANFNEFKIGSDFSTNYPNAENDLSAVALIVM